MDSAGTAASTDAPQEQNASRSEAEYMPHSSRFPQAEQSDVSARHNAEAKADQRLITVDQDRGSGLILTKKNLDEHNLHSGLHVNWRSNLEFRRQQFAGFREAARVLGIDFSDQTLAAMWQGLHGLTPVERFLAEQDNLSLFREAARPTR